jgi:hypothetical protein
MFHISSLINNYRKCTDLPLIFFILRNESRIFFSTELISMAANTFRNKTAMSKYIQSILQCNVVLDRLEQSTIDQLMQISTEDNDKCTSITVRIYFLLKKSNYFLFIIVNNGSIIM